MNILWNFLFLVVTVGPFPCILWSYLRVKVQNGNVLGVAKISNAFGRMSDFFFFFFFFGKQ